MWEANSVALWIIDAHDTYRAYHAGDQSGDWWEVEMTPETRQWCNENLEGRWDIAPDRPCMSFELERDAILFKLRWL